VPVVSVVGVEVLLHGCRDAAAAGHDRRVIRLDKYEAARVNEYRTPAARPRSALASSTGRTTTGRSSGGRAVRVGCRWSPTSSWGGT